MGSITLKKVIFVIFSLFAIISFSLAERGAFTCEKSKDQCVSYHEHIIFKNHKETKSFKMSDIKNLSLEEYTTERTESSGSTGHSSHETIRELHSKVVFNFKNGTKMDYPFSESTDDISNGRNQSDFGYQENTKRLNDFENYLKSKDDKYNDEFNAVHFLVISVILFLIGLFILLKKDKSDQGKLVSVEPPLQKLS